MPDLTLAERVGLRILVNLGWVADRDPVAADVPYSLTERGLVSDDGITKTLTDHGRQVAKVLP